MAASKRALFARADRPPFTQEESDFIRHVYGHVAKDVELYAQRYPEDDLLLDEDDWFALGVVLGLRLARHAPDENTSPDTMFLWLREGMNRDGERWLN